MLSSNGYGTPDAKSPLRSFHFSRRELGPATSPSRRFSAGLPLRSAHGPQRVGQRGVSHGAGPRNRGPRNRRGQRGEEVQGGPDRGDRRDRGLVPPLRAVQTRRGAILREGVTLTYASPDRVDGSITMGGYSNNYVVDERFAHTVPANLDLAGVAPLLCAGITTYSPLRHWNGAPERRSASSGWAGWATWRSSSRTPSARRLCNSPPRQGRRTTQCAWARMRWFYRLTLPR